MDFMKSAGFHGWNLPDFTGEIHQISRNLPDFMKSAGFQGEIHQISRILWISWNLPDFTGEIRQISWISWNLYEIRWISWNPYEIRRISWTWAFGWWSSIGLSIERPKINNGTIVRRVTPVISTLLAEQPKWFGRYNFIGMINRRPPTKEGGGGNFQGFSQELLILILRDSFLWRGGGVF